jgi:S1-C subfamily serine protease
MPSLSDWKVSPSAQPNPRDYTYDLDRALSAVVGLRANIPADAYTADILGTERAGNGVLIRKDGLLLTIGYLISEADQVWLHLADGNVVPGHALAYDAVTGFGLVQALGKLELPALTLGRSSAAKVGDKVVVAGAGGRERSVAGEIVAKQEFAGYWEYLLDEALFTAPVHPNWGGTAVIGPGGDLIGIGSLQLERARDKGRPQNINMNVPKGPARPWLGLYATEVEDRVVVMGLANRGPAEKADLRTGDVVIAVGGKEVRDLGGLFRNIWSLGEAGVEVPLTIWRDGDTFDVRINSGDRGKFMKRPSVH